MSLLSWLSQSESGLDDVDFATTSTNAANRKMDAADMTDETPSPERKAVNLSRQTDIVVELSQISPTRKKEFVLVEDLDDDYDAAYDETYSRTRGHSRKRKLDQDAEYDDDQIEEDDYRSSQSQSPDTSGRISFRKHVASSNRISSHASGRTSGRNTRQSSHLASDPDDSQGSDDIVPGRATKRLRPRRPAPKPAGTSRFGQDDDLDELMQDPEEPAGSDGDFVLIQSDIQPRRKTKRRKRSSRITLIKSGGPRIMDDIEFEAPRRSSRSNKNTGSMMDPVYGDDDNYVVDVDRTPAVPKVIAVKEIFQPLTVEEAGFKKFHNPACSTCATHSPIKGAIVLCQGCSNSYHKACLGQRAARDHLVTKIGQESFALQCRHCINMYKKKDRRAPDLARCQTCHKAGKACQPFSQRKTAKQEEQLRLENNGEDPVHEVDRKFINNAETCLFRCTTCRRGFHFEHLPRPASQDPTHVATDNVRAKNLDEYSIEWKCRDCLDAPAKIDGLVAWRPIDRKGYKGQSYSDYTEDEIEYLIKWDRKSYRHCTWMPGNWVWGACHGTMRTSWAKRVSAEGIGPQFEYDEAVPEEYITIDVVLSVIYKTNFRAVNKKKDFENVAKVDKIFVKFLGLGYEESAWDEPPPPDSGKLYEEFLLAYDEYLAGLYFNDEPRMGMAERIKEYRALDFFKDLEKPGQPKSIQNGELMGYQVAGVNWLKYNYHKKHNAILADEMGLGKTVQIVALIADLVMEQPRVWPWLVVVPNSTVPNWRREIKKWAPDLRVVTYHGGKKPQELALLYELFPRSTPHMRAHVVVMSYEAAQDPSTRLRFSSVLFAGLIVDEGHRLKNDQNLLYAALIAMKIPYRVLLTGTPLQNNKRELFNLLQFLNPKFNAAKLDMEYGELTADNIPKLHDVIRPFFLRRTKADTLKFLPKMARVIIPVTMTVLQEKLSKSIIAKNSQLIQAILAKGKLKANERGSLNNILMQLRKCLCHPFIYSSAVEERIDDPAKMHDNLVDASSKLLLLNIMLPKLHEQGHRVLLFSQFLNQLDIMEDFLSGIGLTYSRIDGNMSSLEKQKRIDLYNAPDSPIFAMLLSTRAGGVGINLATADTVIILDPDFNPHQDLQAVSRCHRIGQRKPVLCFQLTTKDSVEEKILQAGRKKMALDHALIESMDDQKEEVHDLESILKHGAEALFGDGKREKITYDSASVDKLLDRERLIAEQNPPDQEEGQTLNAAFSFAHVWDNNAGDLITETAGEEAEPVLNQSVWAEILRKREEEARLEAEANKEVLGRGGRRRGKAVQYGGNRLGDDAQDEGRMGDDFNSDLDDDFHGSGDESGDDSDAEAKDKDRSITPPSDLAPNGTGRGKKSKSKLTQDSIPASAPADADKPNRRGIPSGGSSNRSNTPTEQPMQKGSDGNRTIAPADPRKPKSQQGGQQQPNGRTPYIPSRITPVPIPILTSSRAPVHPVNRGIAIPSTSGPSPPASYLTWPAPNTIPPKHRAASWLISTKAAFPSDSPDGNRGQQLQGRSAGAPVGPQVNRVPPPPTSVLTINGRRDSPALTNLSSTRVPRQAGLKDNVQLTDQCVVCDISHGTECPILSSRIRIRLALDELKASAMQGQNQQAIALKRSYLLAGLRELERQQVL